LKKILLILLVLLSLYGCKTNDENKRLAIPQNLRYEGSTFSFDAVEHATSYVLEINGEQIILTSTSHILNLAGDYSIRVKARAEGYFDSFYSDRYVFSIHLELQNVRHNYSVQSTFDLIVYTFSEDVTITNIKFNNQIISSDHYIYTNRQLFFKSSYLSTLTPLLYVFEISLGNKGSFHLNLNVIDTNLPYIVSYNNVTFEEGDITLQFELFGGNIQGLTSSFTITTEDYQIEDHMLTIKSAYISRYFEQFPSQDTLSLRYTLNHNDEYVIGYIFINRSN